MISRIYELVDGEGRKYFCDNPDCGSNFMVRFGPTSPLYCNACLTQAPQPAGVTIIERQDWAVVEDEELIDGW